MAAQELLTTKDLRREPREARSAILITPVPGEHTTQAVPVSLVNVSVHGVCIRADRPFAPGSDLVLKPDADSEFLLVYSVRFCEPAADGYEVGGEYVASMCGRQKLDANGAYAMLGMASKAA